MLYVTHDQVEAMTRDDRIVVLEGGHVKQIDTPMNLYERPKNTFVAAFIGSPSMNLITGRFAASTASGLQGGVEFRAADGAFTMALGAQWGSRLASRVGRAVILGIRPEDILILPEGSTAARVGTGTEVELLSMRSGCTSSMRRVGRRCGLREGSHLRADEAAIVARGGRVGV